MQIVSGFVVPKLNPTSLVGGIRILRLVVVAVEKLSITNHYHPLSFFGVGGFAAVSACCFPEILDAVSPKSGNVGAVSPKLLPWTLYRELIRIEDGVARKWYEQEALRETWSSRTLHRNIG